MAAVGLLEEPTRRALYEWVVVQPEPVGREHAAQALRITRALATFHLEKLVDGGLLQAGYQRLTGKAGPGAGRPARVYSRASREISVTLPERRYARAGQIFADALERLGGGQPPKELIAAARNAGQRLGEMARRGSARTRMWKALSDGGYEPLEDVNGTIRLRNCPFDELAQAHRGLMCGANLAMAEGLREAAGAGDWHPILDPRPGYCCVALVPSEAKP